MCGIVGFNWEDKALVERMMKKVAHRGPDQHGHYLNAGISLGHQRLSIVDLSEKGRQPIYNEQGTVCVILNGEIYNHQELRTELQAKHQFATNTDTEVIVHAYEEWNLSAISRLNGMFAFALYDEPRKMLVLARDRIGMKPLYYYWKDNKLLFASEIKALFEASIPQVLRKESVGDVLQFGFVPSPNTMWENIYKIPPGHFATLKDNQLDIKKYWDILFLEGGGTEAYYGLSFRAVLKQAVKQQLMADVPYGAYLSGGLDSGSIVSYMSTITKHAVKTFSVGFDDDRVADETKYARVVADACATDHREVHVSTDQVLEVLPTLAYHLDEPIGNAAAVPLYYLAQEAKKKVTVVLTGNGGDELFGGYRQHKVIAQAYRVVQKIPFQKWMLSAMKTSAQVLPSRLARYASFGTTFLPVAHDPARAYATLMYKTFPDKVLTELGISHQPAHERIAPFFATQDKVTHQIMKLDMKFLLAENYLMVDDKVNMIHAVESRVPYLDNTMLEFAANLPAQLKVHGLTGKYIVRKAMTGILPKQIINRHKYGFTPPVQKWCESFLQKHCVEVFNDRKITTALGIPHQQMQHLLHRNDGEHRNRIFPLVMLGEWAKIYLQ